MAIVSAARVFSRLLCRAACIIDSDTPTQNAFLHLKPLATRPRWCERFLEQIREQSRETNQNNDKNRLVKS